MENTTLETSFGAFELRRLPEQKNHPLKAWNAADEYILSYLFEETTNLDEKRILIVNDAFGALTLSLHKFKPVNWSDSYLSQQACVKNFRRNHTKLSAEFVESTTIPEGHFDYVLVKVPKTLALLEHQLIQMKSCIDSETTIIAAGMVKHLPKSVFSLFEKIIGETTTSLAKKKARLIFSKLEKNGVLLESPYPKNRFDQTTELHLCNGANVFSKDKLDIGARFMLEFLRKIPKARHIVDLGCGDGVLGIMAQKQQPDAHLSFLDESFMAVASAKINYEHVFRSKTADFLVGDCFDRFIGEPDLILCNPPFHQQHSVGDFIAWHMFTSSLNKLEAGGELWVVANRHLGYQDKLVKLFGNCKQIAASNKFVILRAVKR